MKNNRLPEELLLPDISRYSQFPIKYPEIQKMYELAEASFWSSKEIDYMADLNDFESLTKDEKHFVENILGFFSQSDGIVFENLSINFINEIQATEARNFYGFQAMMENIHGMTYGLLIETFVKDPKRKKELFNAIETIPCIKKKADWCLKWFDKSRPFEERILAFAIVEGVFFSGSFCAIFWLKSRNLMCKALGKSNELISRDEDMHTQFAILIYEHLNNKVTQERIEEILKDAVQIETEFICDSIPCRLIGMNSDLMSQYIKFVGDRLLVQLGFKKIYNVQNPFDFMEKLSLREKTNFFENKSTSYRHASTAKKTENSWDFDIDNDIF